DAITEVKDELVAQNPKNELWESWTGDPCLPLPWEGLFCIPNNQGSFIINNLYLSWNNLQGSLPSTVTKLSNLEKLDVSHNEFVGSIPESFSSMPHLTRLYFGCNPQFKNVLLPSLMDRSNLTTDYGKCAQASKRSMYVIGTAAGGAVFFSVAFGALFLCFCRKRRKSPSRVDEEIQITNE
ncbi:hypothetical protein MKX03_016276, partial [Papaver bracteatum]